MLSKADQIYSKIDNIVEYDYKLNNLSVLKNFKMLFIPVILKWNFQQHDYFRNHNMLIWCSRYISYYQFWKLLHIFVETVTSFSRILWWLESSKEQHLFEIEIFF